MRHTIKTLARASVTALLAVTLLAPAALAKPADVIRTGDCAGTSDWKLALGRDNGQIELELEVDQNVVGDVWRVRIRHNGVLEFKLRRTTQAPSGSFTVRRLVADEAGGDRIRARAVNIATGEVCVARARI